MKNIFLGILFITACIGVSAQVDIDKSINLTGTGSNAKISGIKQVDVLSDAVSVEALQQGGHVYAAASGIGSAYTVAINPAPTAYTHGFTLNFRANVANTGAVTLTVNALAAIAIKKDANVDLAAGDIQAGQIVSVVFDGTNFQVKSRTQVNNTGGTVTQVNTGAGLTGGPVTTTGTLSIDNGAVTNAMLQNPAITVNPGTGLTGGGSVSLGGAVSIGIASPVIAGDGGTGASGLTGALIGNGASPVTSAAASGASQYLRRNSGNSAYEFGQIDYGHIAGAPSSLPPSGAASGDLADTYPAPSLAAVGIGGTYNYVTTDAKGRVTSGALRTLTGATNQIDATNGDFSADPSVSIGPSYSATLKSQPILTGGGTVTYSGGTLNWSNRFIVICAGKGPHFTTDGYFDIYMPADGAVIPGVGGAGDLTASGGVPVPCWQSLYYILPIGSGQPSIAGNFRIVNYYPTAFEVPENWILIAAHNCDDGTIRLGSGTTLSPGQTWSVATGMVQNSGSGSYIQNQSASAQPANFNISGMGDAGPLHSKTNDSWIGHPNGNNYLRGNTYAFNSTWYDEDNEDYMVDPNGTSKGNYLYRANGFNGSEGDANDGNFYIDPNGNSVLRNIYQNCPGPAAHNVLGDLNQWLGYAGSRGLAQYQYNYLYPGRVDGGGWQGDWYLGTHGAYGMYTNTGLNISGDMFVDGTNVLDYTSTWHRSYWGTGWYNGSYGGGWYMVDGTWVRQYGNKSVLSQVNSGSPAIRGDQAYSGAWGAEIYSYDGVYGQGMYVGGYIQAYYIYEYSTREKKKDIEKFGKSDYASALAFMDKFDLSYYRFKGQDNYPKIHVGLIAEETPTTLTAPGKTGVSYSQLAVFCAGAVKELKSKVENLEKGSASISDFDVGEINGPQQWVKFSDEFKTKLNGNLPVVSITAAKLGAKLHITEVNAEGFKVEAAANATGATFNWIAMANAPVTQTAQANARNAGIGTKFQEMLQSAENDTRPVPKLSETPTPMAEDPGAPWKVANKR